MMDTLIFHPWYWLVLSLLLIGLESLGTGGFLLGAAVAGLLTALITWLHSSFHWTTQVIIFSGLTIVFTLAYYLFFKRFNQKSDNPKLNDRAAQLHGRAVQLSEDFPFGQGRVQVGDTLWKAHSETPLQKETSVLIYGNKGMTLLIKPIERDR